MKVLKSDDRSIIVQIGNATITLTEEEGRRSEGGGHTNTPITFRPVVIGRVVVEAPPLSDGGTIVHLEHETQTEDGKRINNLLADPQVSDALDILGKMVREDGIDLEAFPDLVDEGE